LSKEDEEYVHERIREVWQPAPAPALPEHICLQFWKSSYRGMCTAQFSDDGISLERRRGRRTRNRFLYGWLDVRQVLILRPSHEHRGFRSLEISFADGEMIQLKAGQERGVWTGPDPDTVARYVQAHVSSDRLMIRASIGPAHSLEEARYRIGAAERDAQ